MQKMVLTRLSTIIIVAVLGAIRINGYGIRPATKPQGIGSMYNLIMYQQSRRENNIGIMSPNDEAEQETAPLGICRGIFADIQNRVYKQAANDRCNPIGVHCYGYNNGIACMVDDSDWYKARYIASDYCLNILNCDWIEELPSLPPPPVSASLRYYIPTQVAPASSSSSIVSTSTTTRQEVVSLEWAANNGIPLNPPSRSPRQPLPAERFGSFQGNPPSRQRSQPRHAQHQQAHPQLSYPTVILPR